MREARLAAEQARVVDAEALAEAARKGAKPPVPTQPKREAEREAAEAAYRLTVQQAEQAIKHFHQVLIDHVGEARDAQVQALRDASTSASEAIEEAIAALEHQSREACVLGAICGADEWVDTAVRGLVYRRVGKIDFDAPPQTDIALHKLAPLLRQAVEQLGAEPAETAGECLDREELELEQRRRTQMPRSMVGGIYAGG
jgi:hypothetical protein